MKIVLTHGKNIKLYSDALNYQTLFAFVVKEFQLIPTTVSLTFKDEEGDQITILSDDDLDVMQAVFQGKPYTKISIHVSEAPQLEKEEISITEASQKVETTVEVKEAPKEDQKAKLIPEETKCFEYRGDCKRRRWGRGSHSREHEHGSPRHHSGHKMEKITQMKQFFDGIVSKLVDERLKTMLPIIKEKILRGDESVSELMSDLIHKDVGCSSCSMQPISGIRYKCPTCANFNLCEICQPKIDHDHPLLKMKKAYNEEKRQKDLHEFGHLLKKFFKPHHHHHGRHSSSQESKEKCHGPKKHHFFKKIWGLSFLFGGEPEQYREFAEQTKDLFPREAFKKYAEKQGISDEEFHQRFVNMRCQKLSRLFGKDAESYKNFVEETFELKQKDMMNVLFEKGIEKRQNKKCWWGRRFNFNQEADKQQRHCSKSLKDQKEKKERTPRKCPRDMIRHKPRRTSPMQEPAALDSAAVTQAKGAILLSMKEVFGAERQSEYVKFIDQYFSLGAEQIFELWMQQKL